MTSVLNYCNMSARNIATRSLDESTLLKLVLSSLFFIVKGTHHVSHTVAVCCFCASCHIAVLTVLTPTADATVVHWNADGRLPCSIGSWHCSQEDSEFQN